MLFCIILNFIVVYGIILHCNLVYLIIWYCIVLFFIDDDVGPSEVEGDHGSLGAIKPA